MHVYYLSIIFKKRQRFFNVIALFCILRRILVECITSLEVFFLRLGMATILFLVVFRAVMLLHSATQIFVKFWYSRQPLHGGKGAVEDEGHENIGKQWPGPGSTHHGCPHNNYTYLQGV